MVTIPRATRQVSSDVFNRPAAARAPFLDVDPGAPGRALVDVGREVRETGLSLVALVQRREAQAQKVSDGNYITETTTALARDFEQEFQKRRTAGDPSDDKFTADFDTFMGQRIDEGLAQPPALPNGRSAVSAEAMGKAASKAGKLREGMFKRSLEVQSAARDARAVANIQTFANTVSAGVQRRPEDLASALALVDGTLASYAGGLPRQDLAEQRVRARTHVLASAVGGLIERGDFAAARGILADTAFDGDLGPETRKALATSIAVEEWRAKAEADARRREDAAVARLAVEDAEFVLARGRIPPDLFSTRGLVLDMPELRARLDVAMDEAGTMGEFAHLPPAGQAARIAELDAKETLSRRQTARLENMARVHVQALKAIEDDPLAYADDIDAIGSPLTSLDFAQPETLKRRAGQAASVAEFLGVGTVSPLQPHEAKALEGAIDRASGDQIAGLFASLATGFGREGAEAVAGQIAPGRPALAVAVARAAEAPLVAAEIVRGERLVRENTEVVPSRAEIEPLIGDRYRGLFREVPSALNAHVEAAKAIYAARKVPTGDFAFDGDLFEDALRLAAGGAAGADGTIKGGPIEFNGQLILPPVPGLDEDAFADLVGSLSADDLARLGNGAPVFADGRPFTPDLFDAGVFGTDAQLLSVAPGRYRVFLPGLGYVMTPAGDAYEIDLRARAAGRGGLSGGVSVPLPPSSTPGGGAP